MRMLQVTVGDDTKGDRVGIASVCPIDDMPGKALVAPVRGALNAAMRVYEPGDDNTDGIIDVKLKIDRRGEASMQVTRELVSLERKWAKVVAYNIVKTIYDMDFHGRACNQNVTASV